MSDYKDHPDYAKCAALATAFLDAAGTPETARDLIQWARSVTSPGVDQAILSLAVADVFSEQWKSMRAN